LSRGLGDVYKRLGDDWPLPLPRRADEDDLFRLPEKPKQTNPFGDD
jgi:hypothetical protein